MQIKFRPFIRIAVNSLRFTNPLVYLESEKSVKFNPKYISAIRIIPTIRSHGCFHYFAFTNAWRTSGWSSRNVDQISSVFRRSN